MADAPLASVAQLGAFLKTTFAGDDPAAAIYLQIASGMVRDFLQQKITASVGDVIVVDSIDGMYALLPELPVTAVSLVESFDGTVWSTVDPSMYTVSLSTGIVTATPLTGTLWPSVPASWRITYSHGFTAVPDALMGVTLGVAARGYASEPGIDLERIGGYQVKYATVEADGFSPIELKALARYIVPRIA